MVVRYPSHIRWVKDLHHDGSFQNFSDNARQKLRSTIKNIDSKIITSSITPIDPNFLSWFVTLYERNLAQKDNPTIFPVSPLLAHDNKTYQALSLYEAGRPIGATIFVVTSKGNISTVYRAYESEWQLSPFRASPALYAEYLLECYASRIGARQILHGRDRNPYGFNSGIGVAMFKLSVGCVPFVSKTHTRHDLDTTTVDRDVLVLGCPVENATRLIEAYLVTTPETSLKWLAVTKYPEIISVQLLYRMLQ